MFLQSKCHINYSMFKSNKINGKILTNEHERNKERLRLVAIRFSELITLTDGVYLLAAVRAGKLNIASNI